MHALILCKNEELTPNDFYVKSGTETTAQKDAVNYNLDENEQNLIRLALKEKNYNQNKASELLGITRDSLIRRMKKFGIQVSKGENK